MFKTRQALRGLSIFFLVLLLTTLFAAPAMAFDERSGPDVTIGSGEVINNDLYLFGTNIRIDGTVNGDVFAFGQDITVNGTINGGLTVAGQSIILNGQISRGVRAAGQMVDVGGNIERDLIVAGNVVKITRDAKVGSDLLLGAETSTVDGNIAGNIKAAIGKVTISNSVGGNVELTGREITIASTAEIKGNLTYTSENNAIIQSGASIGGTTSHKQPEPSRPARNLFIAGIVGTIVSRILAFLTLFIIGLIFILIIPRKMKVMADSLRTSPASSLGWGALLVFVTPIAAIIVMLTIVGLPLGIISIVLWGIALYLSEIPVAIILGWLILKNNQDLGSKGILIGVFALGLFIISLLTAIPVVGWIIWLFVAMFGVGTLISSLRSTPTTPP